MNNIINYSKQSLYLVFGAVMAMATILTVGVPVFVHAESIDRQLSLGMSGADVTLLQTFLAKDSTIYPQGIISGYFGSLTQSAVSNFQARNGISTVGRVGPVTLNLINGQLAGQVVNTNIAPTISNVGVNTGRNGATVNWNTNEFAKGVVYYSPNPLITNEHEHSVDVSGSTAMTDSNYRTNQSVLISGLQANTIYYYMIYTTDQGGNVSVTWPTYFQTTN